MGGIEIIEHICWNVDTNVYVFIMKKYTHIHTHSQENIRNKFDMTLKII